MVNWMSVNKKVEPRVYQSNQIPNTELDRVWRCVLKLIRESPSFEMLADLITFQLAPLHLERLTGTLP